MTDVHWWLKAACRNHPVPNLWFPQKGTGDAAKSICMGCDVRRQCGQDAIDRCERDAVAAGFKMTDLDERNGLRAFLGLPPERGKSVPCVDCGVVFETRRANRLCPDCCDTVDARPAAAWVRELRTAGMSWREIASGAEVSPHVVRALVGCAGSRVTRAITRDRAGRILAIPVPQQAVS